MKFRHVEILGGENGVDVIADDWEVFDYLDDVFTVSGLDSEFTREEVRNGHRVFIMHFPSSVDESAILRVLESVPREEVERIWKINN